MTILKKEKKMSILPFIAYDGHKSEVLVEIGEGTIVEIRDKTSSSQIIFKHSNPKLKKDSGGWVSQSDPLYTYAKQAHDEGRTVSFRIEIQRKNGQPLDTPIRELRGDNDMALANKNTSRILARIDEVFSKEAVTDPAYDITGGRKAFSASQKENSGAPSVDLDTVRNLLPHLTEDSALTLGVLSGESEENIKSFAQNVTQSPNKMSKVIFGVVNEISTRFPSAISSPDLLKNASNGVLYIADSVQVDIFELSKADRYSDSHEQIRTMVLSHVDDDGIQAIANKNMEYITNTARHISVLYKIVLEIFMTDAPKRYIPLSNQPSQQSQGQHTRQQSPVEPPRVQQEETSEQNSPSEQGAPSEEQEEEPFIYSIPPQELEEMWKNGTAKDETVSLFASNFGEVIPKEEWGDLANFLEYVFGKGVKTVRKAPDEALRGLIDAYAFAGKDSFRQAVLHVSRNLA